MNDLSTDAAVIAYDPRVSAINATQRDAVRTGVSERMVRHMGRRYLSPVVSGVEQYVQMPGNSELAVLADWPVTLTSVERGGTALDSEDYRLDGDRGVLYLGAGGVRAPWPCAEYLFTYDAGVANASLPADLVHACTWQTVFELMRIQQRIIGVTQRDPQTGAVDTIERDGWLRSVRDSMAPYRSLTT